jgi:hypothetical protein
MFCGKDCRCCVTCHPSTNHSKPTFFLKQIFKRHQTENIGTIELLFVGKGDNGYTCLELKAWWMDYSSLERRDLSDSTKSLDHRHDRCISRFEMKRRDDNRQLRPEELDALENETTEAGVFERAPADVIAARRIIKPKR